MTATLTGVRSPTDATSSLPRRTSGQSDSLEVPRMRATMRTRLVGALTLAVLLAGCEGGEDLDALANEACDLYDELVDPDTEADAVDEAVAALTDLEERAEEAGYSEDELVEALQRNCPELPGEQ